MPCHLYAVMELEEQWEEKQNAKTLELGNCVQTTSLVSISYKYSTQTDFKCIEKHLECCELSSCFLITTWNKAPNILPTPLKKKERKIKKGNISSSYFKTEELEGKVLVVVFLVVS